MPGSRFALARQQSEGLSAPPLQTHASAALSTCEGCLPFFVLPSRRRQYHRRWHGGRGLVNHRLMQIIGKASWGKWGGPQRGPRDPRAQGAQGLPLATFTKTAYASADCVLTTAWRFSLHQELQCSVNEFRATRLLRFVSRHRRLIEHFCLAAFRNIEK